MTSMVARLDDLGPPIWVALLVLSFVVFWPVGLALLAFLMTSGRLGSHRRQWCAGMARGQRWARPHWHSQSGNSAFDEYREQTLQRLEEEQREFREFLKQLRMAKDRTEFDRFMAGRNRTKNNADADDDSDEESSEAEPRTGESSRSTRGQDGRPSIDA